MNALKRGGFRVPGSDRPVNPNEKPQRINGWLISSWTMPGNFLVIYLSLGNAVLSLCGGSGSLMESCIYTGRSCIMFEKDGLLFYIYYLPRAAISGYSTANGSRSGKTQQSWQYNRVLSSLFVSFLFVSFRFFSFSLSGKDYFINPCLNFLTKMPANRVRDL